jgi:hypothetical protein
MADDARALLLTIQANTELLRSNLSAAERAVEEATRNIQGHLDEQDHKFELFGKGLEKIEAPLERLKALGEVAVGALLGESLIEAGKKGLEFAGNIKFVSEQVGTSTDFLQKYRFAASQFGVATGIADEGLNKFSRSIGEAANGNKSLVDLFTRLGVSIFDSAGKLRSVEAIYLDTSNAISRLDAPAQRSADTMQLMGKGAASLVPLLSDGAAGFNQLATAAQQLGVVLSPELIEHSEEVNHKLAALKEVVDAQMASAIAQNATAIESLASAFVKAAGGVAQFLGGHPERALAILGAMAGSRVGGTLGAIGGAGLGYAYGTYLRDQDRSTSTDPQVRKEEFVAADQAYKEAKSRVASGGHIPGASFRNADDSSVYARQNLEQAKRTLVSEYQKYRAALAAPKAPDGEGGFGSNGAGATNDNGDALRNAQSELAKLEQQKKGASGAALTAYNEEIAAKKRQISFIKQGATAEMASSLAAKQGSAEKAGETAATKAARKAAEERLRSIEEDRAYAGEIASADRAIAEAKLKLANTSEARYQIEVQRLRDDLAGKDRQVDDEVAAGKRTPEQGLRLKVKFGSAEQLGEQGAAKDRGDHDAQDQLTVQQDTISRERDHLQAMEDLATTTKERRDIALKLLDLDQEAQRAALEYQRDHGQTQADRDRAQKGLDALPAQTADRHAVIDRQNEGPLDQYRHQLQGSVGDTSTALQGVGVDGLHSLEDGLIGISTGAETAKQALHNMFLSLLTDLEKLALEKGLLALLGGSGSGATGSSGGGFLGTILGGIGSIAGSLFGGGGGPLGGSAFDSAGDYIGDTAPASMAVSSIDVSTPGFLSGGSMLLGGDAGTDKNQLSLNGKPLARVSRGETLAIVPANDTTPARAVIPASVPDMADIGQARMQAVQSQVKLQIDPSEMFDVRATQNAHDVVDQRKPELVASSAAAVQDLSARRVISVRSR